MITKGKYWQGFQQEVLRLKAVMLSLKMQKVNYEIEMIRKDWLLYQRKGVSAR